MSSMTPVARRSRLLGARRMSAAKETPLLTSRRRGKGCAVKGRTKGASTNIVVARTSRGASLHRCTLGERRLECPRAGAGGPLLRYLPAKAFPAQTRAAPSVTSRAEPMAGRHSAGGTRAISQARPGSATMLSNDAHMRLCPKRAWKSETLPKNNMRRSASLANVKEVEQDTDEAQRHKIAVFPTSPHSVASLARTRSTTHATFGLDCR